MDQIDPPRPKRPRKPRAARTVEQVGGTVVPFPAKPLPPSRTAAESDYTPGAREKVHKMVDIFLDALHAAYGPGAQRQPDTDPAA